jgi:hypothetical protein
MSGAARDLFEAADEAERSNKLATKLNAARSVIRQMVIEKGWAPDTGALPGRKIGMRIEAAEAVLATVTRGTLEAYERRGIALVKKYLTSVTATVEFGEAGGDILDFVSPLSFVTWLAGMRPLISSSTWRQYKQAGLAGLDAWPGDKSGCAEAAEELERIPGTGTIRLPRGIKKAQSLQARTSAKRLSALPMEDLESIFTEIARRASGRGVGASDRNPVLIVEDWLVAATAVGLRPVEWRQSRMLFETVPGLWPPVHLEVMGGTRSSSAVEEEDAFAIVPDEWSPPSGRVFLVVHSTKHSNDRGNQPVRILEVTNMPLDVLQAVARMVLRGARGEESFAACQKNAAKLLSRMQAHIWPRRRARITIYSARHQSLANWKEAIGTLESAVLAGHGIPDGPDRYYARRSNAWDRRKGRGGSSDGGPGIAKLRSLAKAGPPGRNSSEKESLLAKSTAASLARLDSHEKFSEIANAPPAPVSPSTDPEGPAIS